jgi:hypothetical protein
MADLILPGSTWPRLPPVAATRVGQPVQGPVLHALGRAAIWLLGIKGRHVVHRSIAVAAAAGPGTMAAETIRLWWACRFHAEHVAALVRYQGLDEGKEERTLGLALCKKTLGGAFGSAEDEISFEVARGTLALSRSEDASRVEGYRWPVLEAFTGIVPNDGAGAYVIRPLQAPGGAQELGLELTVSEGIRVVSVDVWELAEEAIEQ